MHKCENQVLKTPKPDTRVYPEGFSLSEKKNLVKMKFLYCQITFWKCNGKMHESAGFLVWALPVVQNHFWKQFSNEVLYNYCSKYLFWAFWSVLKKSFKKNWFFIIFSKSDLAMEELYFHPKKILKRQNSAENLIFTFVHYHPRLPKPVWISCLYITSVQPWMKTMETIAALINPSTGGTFLSMRPTRLGEPPLVSLLH